MVCCVFSLESPHQGDSNENTRYTIFDKKKKVTSKYPKSSAVGYFGGLKIEFETAVVNEPSVFEPLKFCCTHSLKWRDNIFRSIKNEIVFASRDN